MGSGTWESHHAITQLLYEYHTYYNRGLYEEMGALFEHATYQTKYPWSDEGHGIQRGSEVTENFKAMVHLYDGLPRVQMSLSNIVLDIDEDDGSAESWSQYFGLFGPPGTWSGHLGLVPGDETDSTIRVLCAGRYEDRFERIKSEWRFSSRIIHADLTGDRSGHMRLDPVAYGKALKQKSSD